ncbi:TonB-dependent receptor [Desulfosarcina ovata]|uniref:TonB-dependent receptor n=1 Tax=Desulfosarcina ovata subsp. ovata TaxID=2752305 RepID=A0A5K8ADK4_9BACT|nr:TonB-dependent receptor [Desulfosarcina ovata]BBO90702.1 TonB-dependent receptor [Desulfosarcina ovata subsp. ovata]
MKKCVGFLFLLTLWMLPAAGPAAAVDEQSSPVVVDEMIVTASRSEQQNEKVPAQITVLTAEDIRASGAQSVPEALQNLGGVIVTDLNGNGFNQQVDMGGFGETASRHVAVVVNGRKINPIDQSSINFLSIPIENVEKIEVLHGGNSVLYGSDAMGGVINIITREATAGVHGWGEAGGGTHDTFKGTAGLSFSEGRFGGHVGAVYYETDGYRERSEADRKSAYAKLFYSASDMLDLSLEANTTRADYEYPGGMTQSQMAADRRQAVNLEDEGESQEDYYVLSVRSDWGRLGRLNVDLSCKNYERQDTMVSWDFPAWGYYGYYDYDYTTLGANPQYVLNHSILGRDNRLTAGIEFYDTDYDAWNGDTATQTQINTYDHEQTSVGFYVQDEFSLVDNLVLNMGARYEDFDTTLRSSLGTDKDLSENEWAWNLGLAYIYAPGSKVYFRTYQAFRFPKADEFMILSTGAVNEDLNHETSMGYEAGVRFVGLDKRLSANARLFSFDVDDEITWNDFSNQNENLDETRHQGGELDIAFQATDLLRLFGGFGYTDAEFTAGTYDGKKIPLVPEFKANLGFALNFDFGLTYRCQYNHLGKRYAGGDNDNAYDKIDSADTVDMYLSYSIKKIELFLNATNIFDEEYHNGYNYGPGYESYQYRSAYILP